MSSLARCLGVGAMLLACLTGAFAADDFLEDEFPSGSVSQRAFAESAAPHNYKWEFGLDVTRESYVQNSNSSAIVDVDKVDELNEERADLRLLPVPAGSKDKVVGHPEAYWEFGLHVYRQIGPLISVGLVGGFGLEKAVTVTDQGTAIAAPMYTIDFSRQIYYAVPSIKLGYWINRFRPYVRGGFGWYNVRERTQARLTFDPFNDFSPGGPFTTSDTADDYTGTQMAAGLDVHVGDNGIIGLEFGYQRIFRPNNPISLVSPGLRFAYLY